MTIMEKARECFPEIQELRRDIHRHPELGRTELRTSALIRRKLEEYGVDSIESPVPTAVVGVIYGKRGAGRCVALRCDIDALPVQEQTGLPFASENDGVMHACGHDMHAAMMMGVAKILCGMRDEFPGCVKLIFQHSEDTLPGGALELTQKGVLENPHVDAIFGMHVQPEEETVGKFGLITGAMTTAVDLYEVTVSGKGGHGSEPQNTTDPVLAAAQMIVAMQQIVARRVDPMEMAVMSIGMINGGQAVNVIPSEVKFSGVSRTYSEEVRDVITEQMMQIARGIETLSGNTVDVKHTGFYPCAYNDAGLIALADEAISAELGAEAVSYMPRPMSFSEDFSYYTKLGGIPGAFIMLSAGHEGELAPLHNPKCAMKEEAMPYGMSALVSIALRYLNSAE